MSDTLENNCALAWSGSGVQFIKIVYNDNTEHACMNNEKPLARDNQSVSMHSDDVHNMTADALPKEGSSQPCILRREW